MIFAHKKFRRQPFERQILGQVLINIETELFIQRELCFPGERVMLLIHRSVDLHQQVADVEKNLRLFSKMIGPHFFDQADGAVLDRVELDGIEREQIFLIFGSVFHQVNVVGGTGAELLCKSGADPENKAAVRHRQVVHHQMMRYAGRNQKKIAGRRCVEHSVDFQ